jgi:hypothetical protein
LSPPLALYTMPEGVCVGAKVFSRDFYYGCVGNGWTSRNVLVRSDVRGI